MNNRGMAAFYLFMVGIVFFLLALALAPVLMETSDQARNADNLDCANASISNQDKSICYQVDAMPPLYTAVLFGLGAMLFTRLIT